MVSLFAFYNLPQQVTLLQHQQNQSSAKPSRGLVTLFYLRICPQSLTLIILF